MPRRIRPGVDDDFKIHVDPSCLSASMDENELNGLAEPMVDVEKEGVWEEHETEAEAVPEPEVEALSRDGDDVEPTTILEDDEQHSDAEIDNIYDDSRDASISSDHHDDLEDLPKPTQTESSWEDVDEDEYEDEEIPTEDSNGDETVTVDNAKAAHEDDEHTLTQDEAEDSHHDYTDSEGSGSRRESGISSSSYESERRISGRTDALIQKAAREIIDQLGHGSPRDSLQSATGSEADSYLSHSQFASNRPSDAHMSVGGESHFSTEDEERRSLGDHSSHHENEDDVFSDHSPRSSMGSMSETDHKKVADAMSHMTMSPRVSDISQFSQYEKEEEFVPTVRGTPRPAFRSPSSVKALQMSSPPPSVLGSPRSSRRFPTVSRLGSPIVSAQYSPKKTPPRFRKNTPPLVLLHVTLLPLRWGWADVLDHATTEELSADCKTLREAWRQLQDRMGDTTVERGILLPHPQNDYEILEERLLEALELPMRRRARILECGHYLGPSNEMTLAEESDSEEDYDDERRSSRPSMATTTHWCKTCRSEIRYDSLGPGKIFRVKVYASNGLMKAGAWDACWKEMERVDVELEPIVEVAVEEELGRLEVKQLREFEEEERRIEEQERALEEQERLMEEKQRELEEQERLFVERKLEEERRRVEEEERRQLEAEEEEERRRVEEEERIKMEEEDRLRAEEDEKLRIEEEKLRAEEEEQLRAEEEALRAEEEEQLRAEEEALRAEEEEQLKRGLEDHDVSHVEEHHESHLEDHDKSQFGDESHLEHDESHFEDHDTSRQSHDDNNLDEAHLEETRVEQHDESQVEENLQDQQQDRSRDLPKDLNEDHTEELHDSPREETSDKSQTYDDNHEEHNEEPDASFIDRVDHDPAAEPRTMPSSPLPDISVGSSPTIEERQKMDEERMREIYGTGSSSEKDQQEPREPYPQNEEYQARSEFQHHGPTPPTSDYVPRDTPPSPSAEAFARREERRQATKSDSLPELLLESVKVLMQDKKNVMIGLLSILILMLALKGNPPQQDPRTFQTVINPRAEVPTVTVTQASLETIEAQMIEATTASFEEQVESIVAPVDRQIEYQAPEVPVERHTSSVEVVESYATSVEAPPEYSSLAENEDEVMPSEAQLSAESYSSSTESYTTTASQAANSDDPCASCSLAARAQCSSSVEAEAAASRSPDAAIPVLEPPRRETETIISEKIVRIVETVTQIETATVKVTATVSETVQPMANDSNEVVEQSHAEPSAETLMESSPEEFLDATSEATSHSFFEPTSQAMLE